MLRLAEVSKGIDLWVLGQGWVLFEVFYQDWVGRWRLFKNILWGGLKQKIKSLAQNITYCPLDTPEFWKIRYCLPYKQVT